MYGFFRTLNLVRQRLILTWVKGSGRGKRESVTATARRGVRGMGRMERSTTTVRIHIAGTSAILVAFTAAWISCLAALPRPPQQAAGVFVLAVALVAAIQVEKTLDVKEARRCARESELEEVMSAEPRSSHVDRRPLLQFPG